MRLRQNEVNPESWIKTFGVHIKLYCECTAEPTLLCSWISYTLPKVYPRCSQGQKADITLGKAMEMRDKSMATLPYVR